MQRKLSHFPLFLLLALVSLLWTSLAAAQAPEGQEYVVQADDWLSKIAEKEYGDLFAYPNIVEATNVKAAEDDSFAVIDNPDIIEIGQKIWLPATLEGSEEIVSEESSEEAVSEAEEVSESEALEPEFWDFAAAKFDNPTNIDNAWLPLQPGTRLIYEGVTVEDGESISHRLVFTVTDLTKKIEGVDTVVAWIVDYADGDLVEAEIAFYAQDNDGNVWYLGEYPEEYEEGEFIDAPTWIAGIEEAKPGLKMMAEPHLEIPSYFQGWGPAVEWSDYAHVDQVGQETCVPVDCFTDVIVIAETSLGETGAFQFKYNAPGVGEVRVDWQGDDETKEELELVSIVQLNPQALEKARAEALKLEAHAYEISEDVYGQTAPAESP